MLLDRAKFHFFCFRTLCAANFWLESMGRYVSLVIWAPLYDVLSGLSIGIWLGTFYPVIVLSQNHIFKKGYLGGVTSFSVNGVKIFPVKCVVQGYFNCHEI